MLAAGIKSPVPLEELESHLREEIERQIQSGANEQQAFASATAGVGQAGPLKAEFKKLEMEGWHKPLAALAWILFVVSFFLPAVDTAWGWECARASALAFSYPEFRQGGFFPVYLESFTLANLLMVVLPVILRFSRNARHLKWLRILTFGAVVLVWSFVLRGIGGPDAKCGCFVWGISFLLLALSLVSCCTRGKVRQACSAGPS